MPATIQIHRLTGAGTPTSTNMTNQNVRCNAVDAPLTDETISPVIIPDTGLTNYSYWAALNLKCIVAPATVCENIVWYTDGANGLGIGRSLVVAEYFGYVQATGVVGVSGIQLSMANHTNLLEEPSNAFDFTIASPKALTGTMAGIGDTAGFVCIQHVIADNAVAGPGSQETISYFFDET